MVDPGGTKTPGSETLQPDTWRQTTLKYFWRFIPTDSLVGVYVYCFDNPRQWTPGVECLGGTRSDR